LDNKIPFDPSWVKIYIDFVSFWIRMISFFLRCYGRKAYKPAKEIILSIGELYKMASVVYKKNLSTTKRPFYIARPHFLLIHLVDPHLMCVPSLHIMVAVFTYRIFEKTARQFADEKNLKEQIDEMKYGALAISQSVLYVKQHSVNCIPAALYAMTCYCPELFPPEEAENFTKMLFSPVPASINVKINYAFHPDFSSSLKICETDQAQIKKYILDLYRRFLKERETSKSWEDPILKFLCELPVL